MKRIGLLFLGVLLPGLLTTLSAAAIVGTFNMSGTVTVSATNITWQSDLGPGFAADMFTLTAGAGAFTGQDGQNGVNDLVIASEPVGTGFANTPFIIFDVAAGLPALDINFIYPGNGGSADCSLAAAVGQRCTPPNGGGSPFTFTNDPPPDSPQSSAQFVFTGVTSDGLSKWAADFTSQFNTPYQTVLAAFAPGGAGFVTNSYSATVTVSAIPEPETLFMLASGLGLLLVSQKLKKYRRERMR